MKKPSVSINRRDFLLGSGALIAGLGVFKNSAVAANSKINIGLIGCGSRGNWITNLFLQHGGYNIAAVADYFQDKVDAIGDRLGVPAERRFTTLSGYKKLLDLKDVDAVVIQTPSYFHPEQARAAVQAGKHVFLAKPVAVDVPGCLTVESSGEAAREKNLCFLVDFQTRVNEHFIEAIKRVHNGAMGDYVFGEAITHTGQLSLKTEPGTPEARLLNWVFDIALSGDIIVEQQVHTLDVMSWIMNVAPRSAIGTGGRKIRTFTGDCWDHFTLLYEYPGDVGITYSGRQFNAHGTQPDGYRCRLFGADGVIETAYGGQVLLRGKEEHFYRGQTGQIFLEGAVTNVSLFYENISRNRFENTSVAPSVRSNLVAILGRMAAYRNERISWEDVLRNEDVLSFDTTGLKQ